MQKSVIIRVGQYDGTIMQRLKDLILTQKPLILERKSRLRWIVGLTSVPLLGLAAAYGIAPKTSVNDVQLQTVVENIKLPVTSNREEDLTLWRSEKIQSGDTVGSLLARLKVVDPEAEKFLRTNAHSLYHLVPGKTVEAKTDQNGLLLSLHYLGPDGNELSVERSASGLNSFEKSPQLHTRILMKSATIGSSLFAATDSVGLADSIATQIADMFASEIDFHRDLRKGDHFTVVYEELYDGKGVKVKSGRILAAEFVNQGKPYRAIYFQTPGGNGAYYTPEGKSLRTAFLRCPLPFSRITSGFTVARFHPFLHKWRAHKGVDFGAPIGTPVRATADGKVEFRGVERGYGNLIVLKHDGKFSTAYGHLSRFASGLHNGEKVSQGEIIGYVGMTGWATGPHLHYEFRVNEKPVDPMKVTLPIARSIDPIYAGAFRIESKPLADRLAMMRSVNLANSD